MTTTETTTETTPPLHHFIVYAPDKTEPLTLGKRLHVRDQHVKNVKALINDGVISELFVNVVVNFIL